MATVTMELRDVLQHQEVNLFNFTYPITDQTWKEVLEEKIIRHYYFHEIGVESIDRFLYQFETKMKEIMGYYNELYKTTLFDGDPFVTQKLTETLENMNTGNQTVSGSTDENVKSSEYPASLNPDDDILSGQSISGATTSQTRVDDLKQNQQRIIEGFMGKSYSELLREHRQSILRIDGLIIQELKHLFILVY